MRWRERSDEIYMDMGESSEWNWNLLRAEVDVAENFATLAGQT